VTRKPSGEIGQHLQGIWRKKTGNIVKPGYDYVLISSSEYSRPVDEYVKAEPLKHLNHVSRIVISKYGQLSVSHINCADQIGERSRRLR